MGEAFNVRCAACGHVGTRRFERAADGLPRDVLAGATGVTAGMTVCDCGSRRGELVPARCHRLLIGQGSDTSDPLCALDDGHAGRCRPDRPSDGS